MGTRLRQLDDRFDGWMRRHESWRAAGTVLVGEIVVSVALSVSIASLISGKADFSAWWIGPLVAFGKIPLFVFFLPPVPRGGWLTQLDDRVLGPRARRPLARPRQ